MNTDRLGKTPRDNNINRTLITSIDPSLLRNFDLLSPEEVMATAIKILKKPGQFRNEIDEQFLKKSVPHIGFFEQVREEHGEEILQKVYKNLGHESYKSGEIVFRINDLGDNFYIILKGKVGVLIPLKEKKTEGKQHGKPTMLEVNELGVGDSFGELALINDRPRMATIICKEDCEFAILERDQYKEILADAQRMKLNQKITNLTTFPIFGEAARGALTSLVMFFETHSYLLNQPLYREGDDATDIYFIMEGEFKLVKNVKIPKEINWNADPIVENFLRKNNDMRKTDIAVYGKGEIIGIEDVVAERKRTMTAICTSIPSKVYKITAHDFRKRLYPALSEYLLRQLRDYVENRERYHNERLKGLMAQIKMNKNLMFDTSSILKYERKIVAPTPLINTEEQENSPQNHIIEFPQIQKHSPSADILPLFMTEAITATQEDTLTKTATKNKLTQKSSKTIKVEEESSSITKNKSFDQGIEKNHRFLSPSLHDRSFDIHQLSHNKSFDIRDRSHLNTKKKSQLDPVAETLPPKPKKEFNHQDTKALYDNGVFELNQPDKSLLKNVKGASKEKTTKNEDLNMTAPLPSRNYITSRPKEESLKSGLEKEAYFIRKEQILEELEKKSKTKELNIQKHLAELIHDDHVLKRRTVGVYDGNGDLIVPPNKTIEEKNRDASKSPIEKRIGLHSKENELKNTVRSIFYRGRKYLRALAENARNKSQNHNQIIWEAEDGGTSVEQRSLIHQPPQEILKPLPISNKQLRNKFMKAKMRHFQVFGRQV